MTYDGDQLQRIFGRTSGKCHICWQPLAFSNYGQPWARGAWEVEHSVPRARGGTDHGNNLYAAHVGCNRSKQARSTRAARAANGFSRAPLSTAARADAKVRNGLTFAAMPLLFAQPLGAGLAVLLSLLAFAVAHDADPDNR